MSKEQKYDAVGFFLKGELLCNYINNQLRKYDRYNRKHNSIQRDRMSMDNYRRTKKTSKIADRNHSDLKVQDCGKPDSRESLRTIISAMKTEIAHH